MCRALPGSEYYGGSAPSQADRRSTRPTPPAPPAAGKQGKTRDGSRVHCGSLNEVGARLCPCGIAASTPQTFLAASLAARAHRLGSSPPNPQRVRTASSPDPPGSSWRRIKGMSNAGSSRTPLRPARRTRTIWQYWPVPALSGLLTALTGATRIRLPSAPPSCCDRISGEGLSPPLETQRLTAHPRPPPRRGQPRPRSRRRPQGRPGHVRPRQHRADRRHLHLRAARSRTSGRRRHRRTHPRRRTDRPRYPPFTAPGVPTSAGTGTRRVPGSRINAQLIPSPFPERKRQSPHQAPTSTSHQTRQSERRPTHEE
jgi:hypothetical protein